jgi:hypothetical protein
VTLSHTGEGTHGVSRALWIILRDAADAAPQDEGRGVKSQTPMVHFANSLDIRPELLYSARLNLQQDAEIQRTWSFPRGFPGSRNGRS